MAALVELRTAKRHLRLLDTSLDDDDVLIKIDQASGIVLTYLKSQAVSGWSDGSVDVPPNIQAAVLIVLGHLYEHRGEDMRLDGPMWDAIKNLLVGFRDPTLA